MEHKIIKKEFLGNIKKRISFRNVRASGNIKTQQVEKPQV